MYTARKTLTAALAAAVVAGGALATATDAEAQHRRHRGGADGAIIAGVIGGLAVGALAASAARSHRRAQRHHYYDGYAPASAYYGGHYGSHFDSHGGHYGYARPRHVNAGQFWEQDYGQRCWKDKRRVFDEYGTYLGRQVVRVCQ